MRATLVEVPYPAISGLRPPLEADMQPLASLMYRAYRGTIDYEGESEAEALVEVQKTFRGEYGAFMPAASYRAWWSSGFRLPGHPVARSALRCLFNDRGPL